MASRYIGAKGKCPERSTRQEVLDERFAVLVRSQGSTTGADLRTSRSGMDRA